MSDTRSNNPTGGMPKIWSVGGQVPARMGFAAPAKQWWDEPMNSQSARLELARQIIAQCRIARIIETGTFLGTTTEFFASYGMPVTTAESNPQHAEYARSRLARWPNVDLRPYDSVRMLRELAAEPIDRAVPTFFYLDAHWEDHLPLREEASLVIKHFGRAVIMVDDFAVPGDPGYGFDDYGDNNRLTLDYLLQGETAALTVYFPSTPSFLESGPRRGCSVAAVHPEIVATLDQIKLLRRWRA